MFGLIDHEILETGTAHGRIEFTRNKEDAVANRLCLQLVAVHAPEEAIVSIDSGSLRPGFSFSGERRRALGCVVDAGCLAIGGAGKDEPVELLKRPAPRAGL